MTYVTRPVAGITAILILLIIGLLAGQWSTATSAQTAPPVAVDGDDIGGVVTGPRGPEAGVWVIAETTTLPTRLRKIVVTDDRGRYLLPDLPKARYRLWVRGYGLVDSPAVDSAPGASVNLRAVIAPNPRAAAQYYPANYWYSLAEVPPESAFPIPDDGTKLGGGGGPPPPPRAKNQAEWISQMKVICENCHQMGTKATREIPKELGAFDSSVDAWHRRIRSGQLGMPFMFNQMNTFGLERGLAMFASWSDRIAAGEVPPAPPRPQGIERNVVITLWDTSGAHAFVHDAIVTDRRRPTVNANGPVYGGEFNYNALTIVDPNAHTTDMVPIPTRAPAARMRPFSPRSMDAPSPYWGEEIIWNEVVQPNGLTMDAAGRVWTVSAIRPFEQAPAFCGAGSQNRFARQAPLTGGRGLSYYDAKTKTWKSIDTCFRTHHIAFAEDADQTLYTTGHGAGLGWVNTGVLLATGNEEAAQGWCAAYHDVNGDGRIDPASDRKLEGNSYGIVYNPVDGSVWFASQGTPGRIFRMVRGANPPESCLFEVYEPPFNNPKAPGVTAFYPRGIDVDRHGLIWTALAGSGHMASFDRRKCAVLQGEAATTGQHCPEGWTLYPGPGPRFKGVRAEINADFYYYNWVDQFDTLGLGPNVPIATGTGSDSLLALLPGSGQWITIRVPYPMGGFYTRNMDGRIDDPRAGWKGRGVWAPNASRPTWHAEGGKGTPGLIAKIQIRPDPLAK